VTLAKSGSRWLIFDDDIVEVRPNAQPVAALGFSADYSTVLSFLSTCPQELDEKNMHQFFGSTSEVATTAESGYILFYQATNLVDHLLDLAKHGTDGSSNPVAAAVAAALAPSTPATAAPVTPLPTDSDNAKPTSATVAVSR